MQARSRRPHVYAHMHSFRTFTLSLSLFQPLRACPAGIAFLRRRDKGLLPPDRSSQQWACLCIPWISPVPALRETGAHKPGHPEGSSPCNGMCARPIRQKEPERGRRRRRRRRRRGGMTSPATTIRIAKTISQDKGSFMHICNGGL